MSNRTIADRIVEAHNTGSDAVFIRDGVTYNFDPEGLKNYISGDSSGPAVDSVNGKTGVVVLNAGDIGAAKPSDLPTSVQLVPAVGTNNHILKVVSGVPSWAAETNTTYTVMSAAEATAGTATTGRTISAKVLADAILERASSYDDTALTQMIGLMQTEIETMQLEIGTLQGGFTTLEGRVAALESA